MIRFINTENVILFHEKIIRDTGGSLGIRDINLIESALSRPFMTFQGIDLYPTAIEKIAVITHSLISNHGFVDGNKRIGVAVMIILLKQNDFMISYAQKELVDLAILIAEGKWNERDIATWIIERI